MDIRSNFLKIAFLTLFSSALLSGAMNNAQAQGLLERFFSGRKKQEQFIPPPGAKVLKDVTYGTHARHVFDVYLPPNPQNAPVILMVHGGGWRAGNKDGSGVIDNKIAHWLPKGYIFISTNYRLHPEADPLTQASDIARALAKSQSIAERIGADANRFVLMGHSAGAHLIALLSASPDLAYELGAKPWRAAVPLDTAAIDLLGIMQTKHRSIYDKVFGGDPEYWKKASPLEQLSPKAIPMLLVCSSTRRDGSCRASEKFATAAKAAGVMADILPQPLKHEAINSELGLTGIYTETVSAYIAAAVSE